MIMTFWRLALQVTRRLYFRVLTIACLALMSLFVAKLLGPFIPPGFSDTIGAKAVDPILATLTSSMLSVTIFSLTIMTATYRMASSQWTPRTHVILRDDTTTHAVLANFVGAYLFALLATVLRSSHFFGEQEIVVLFGFTIGVIAMILGSLVRWIAHLDVLGSLDETAGQVQQRAEAAMRAIARQPCHGAGRIDDGVAEKIAAFHAVQAKCSGYVQQVFPERIQEAAEASDARVYIIVPIGSYVQTGDVLARVATDGVGDRLTAALDSAVRIDTARSFQQDPGFGLSVLSEIGLRALSPGINDPETAIDMVHRLSTVLAHGDSDPQGATETSFDRVWLPPPDFDVFLRSSFDRIAREAGTAIEVHLAIGADLHNLASRCGGDLAKAARTCAHRCATRARRALQDDPDLDLYLAASDRAKFQTEPEQST